MAKPRQQFAEVGELSRLHAETQCDPLARAEEIDEKRHVDLPATRIDGVLEKQRRTTLRKHPSMDFGDFMNQRDRGGDARQKTAGLQAADEAPQVGIRAQMAVPRIEAFMPA